MSIDSTVSRPTRVKFSDSRIHNFFQLLKYSFKTSVNLRFYPQTIMPVKAINSIQNENDAKRLRANALAYISAGHVYENFRKEPSDPGYVTDEMHIENAKAQAQVLEKELNSFLAGLDDPLFASLKAEVVNDTYKMYITHTDLYDNGDDEYGVKIFLRFSYK